MQGVLSRDTDLCGPFDFAQGRTGEHADLCKTLTYTDPKNTRTYTDILVRTLGLRYKKTTARGLREWGTDGDTIANAMQQRHRGYRVSGDLSTPVGRCASPREGDPARQEGGEREEDLPKGDGQYPLLSKYCSPGDCQESGDACPQKENFF